MRTPMWILTGVAALTAAACNDTSNPAAAAAAATAAAQPRSDAPQPPDPDAALDQKLNAAVQCINHASSSALRSRTSYRRGVDPKTGPAPKASISIGRIDPTSCLKELEPSIAATPRIAELDDAATAYATALKALAPVVNDASDYFEQKRNLDDGGARGAELHPGLMAAFDAFLAADGRLRSQVDIRNRARKEARLAELEKDPAQRDLYLARRMMLLAEDVVKMTDVDDIQTIDAAAFAAKVDELDRSYKDLDGKWPALGSSGVAMESNARYYVKAALALSRRLRDKTPYDKHELDSMARGATMIEGSVPQVVEKYNSLIQMSNMTLR
jgi:hypothetical protein